MMNRKRIVATIMTTIVSSAGLAIAQDRVSRTVHNLSVGGPGQVRAQGESQVCVFCHAPHNTSGERPLWNRAMSSASYTIYDSSTLDAAPGQPTGASKLCLSCHDGTIALGSVLGRVGRIRMSGGDYIPAGLSNLGTDLSDDHPISLAYTSGLAAADHQLASPTALPPEVKLDPDGQLQCTACHDPHHNRFGQFLVMPDVYGALCTSCHVMDGWDGASHQMAATLVIGVAGADWPYGTVAENACRSCHRSHTAGGRERLLIVEQEEENCLICHDGMAAGTNITGELDKLSAHDPRKYLGKHDPTETTTGAGVHVECSDCHNPHAATAADVPLGYVPIGETLTNVRGVTIGGALVETAQYEYEVCFRCHGDSAVTVPGRINRGAGSSNLRLAFNPTNASFHPVAGSSPSSDTISLVPGMPTGSMIRCTDCHNNDAGPRGGGMGPDGPHGSAYDFLLERNYTVTDDTAESAFEYAMCYKCHEQSSILGDQSFQEHYRHIVEERAPCSACHDPHGINTAVGTGSDHTHLINFDTTIVFPVTGSTKPVYRDDGTYAGSCTLVCHGSTHSDVGYGGP